MNIKKRRVFILGVAAIGLLFIGFKVSNFLTEFGWSKIDYSKRPPNAVFQFVTGASPPKGVSNLKSAGRVYLGKHWIWLQFNITDEAITKLTAEREGYKGKEALRYIQESGKISANKRYDTLDLSRVNWRNVSSIAQPEVYEVGHMFPNSAFVLLTYMIVDKQNHVAYIYAYGD